MSDAAKITLQQTQDQRRAKHAYDVVEKVKRKFGKMESKEFGSQARKLPIRIIASGLGQSLAFVLAKAKSKDKDKDKLHFLELLIVLGDWVLGVVKPAPELSKLLTNQEDNLLKVIIHSSAEFLRQATDEALAYLLWLNRFCEANKLTDELTADTEA